MLMQRLCSYSQRPFGEPGNVKTVGWSESPTLPVGTKPTMDSRCEFVVWAPNHNYVKLCKSFRARLCRRSFRTASGPLVVAAYPKARQRRSAPARKCLSDFACAVLQAWKRILASPSPYIFPSPKYLDRPISTVKTAWTSTLKRAGVPHFSIYTLRHVFCTRLSAVAPDAVVQRAMRHTSPETKRMYQLGMTLQVREAVEKSNEKAYGQKRLLRFYDVLPVSDKEENEAVYN